MFNQGREIYSTCLFPEHSFFTFSASPLFFPVVLIHVPLRSLAMFACYIGISILNFNALLERALFKAALWLNLPFTWTAVCINYFFTASRLYKLDWRTNSRSHVECSFQRLYAPPSNCILRWSWFCAHTGNTVVLQRSNCVLLLLVGIEEK